MKSACPDLAASSQVSVPGVSRRMPEPGPERNAITPTRGTVRRTGAPRGRTAAHPLPPRSGRGRGPAGRPLGSFYAYARTERRFSANFSAWGGRWGLTRLTPPPPAVLRCPMTRKAVCGTRVTRGVLPKRARGVKRFVIERFTPRYLVDLASDGELVTNAPPDTVDLILRRPPGGQRGPGGGAHAGPRGRRVDSRGLELHEPGVQFRYGDGHSVASTIGTSRHS